MPYLAPDIDPLRRDALDDLANPTRSGPAVASPAGSSPAVSPARPRGSGYTNLSAYVNANRGGAREMAEGVAGGLAAKSSQAQDLEDAYAKDRLRYGNETAARDAALGAQRNAQDYLNSIPAKAAPVPPPDVWTFLPEYRDWAAKHKPELLSDPRPEGWDWMPEVKAWKAREGQRQAAKQKAAKQEALDTASARSQLAAPIPTVGAEPDDTAARRAREEADQRWGLLGSQTGRQALLGETKRAGYTPGMKRLDAFLLGTQAPTLSGAEGAAKAGAEERGRARDALVTANATADAMKGAVRTAEEERQRKIAEALQPSLAPFGGRVLYPRTWDYLKGGQ
jgi:hypothetical protein